MAKNPKEAKVKTLDKMTKKELLGHTLEKHGALLNPKDTSPQMRDTITRIQEGKGAEVPDEHFEGENPFKARFTAPDKNEKPDKCDERFPRIVTSAQIKSYTKDADSISVKFKDLGFTCNQQEILDQMVVNKEEITITLAATQGRLC